jgi:hypothetical protein
MIINLIKLKIIILFVFLLVYKIKMEILKKLPNELQYKIKIDYNIKFRHGQWNTQVDTSKLIELYKSIPKSKIIHINYDDDYVIHTTIPIPKTTKKIYINRYTESGNVYSCCVYGEYNR